MYHSKIIHNIIHYPLQNMGVDNILIIKHRMLQSHLNLGIIERTW